MAGLSVCGRDFAAPVSAALQLLLGTLAALCVLLVLRRHAGNAAALPYYRRLHAAVPAAAALAPSDSTAYADLAAAHALLEAWPQDKPRACITILARNSDLEGVLHSVGQLERRFNARSSARYPYWWVECGGGVACGWRNRAGCTAACMHCALLQQRGEGCRCRAGGRLCGESAGHMGGKALANLACQTMHANA